MNGSFENPSIPAGTYVNYAAGSTDITGWTVVGLHNSLVETTVVDRGITFNAQSGNQWLDLTGPGPNLAANGISQDIITILGQTYEISFYVGSATDDTFYFASTIDLSVNGGPRTGFTNNTAPTDHVDWKLFSSTFTASGNTTNITFYHGGTSGNHIAGLDNVSIATIPEPSNSMIFLSGSLIALSLSRKRHASA
jgi:Protein of unknown function (DUF642)